MADGLAIITGISMLVFLLFYLALSLNSSGDNKILNIVKIGIIFFGLFILSYIPATIQTLDRDCAVLTDGTYRCYMSNGSQVTNYGASTTQVSTGLSVVYLNFLYAISSGLFLTIVWVGGKSILNWWRNRKLLR